MTVLVRAGTHPDGQYAGVITYQTSGPQFYDGLAGVVGFQGYAIGAWQPALQTAASSSDKKLSRS